MICHPVLQEIQILPEVLHEVQVLTEVLHEVLLQSLLQEVLLQGERVTFTNSPDTWVYRASLHH